MPTESDESMKDEVFTLLLLVIFIGGFVAAGIAIFINNWNECRAVFSFLYCLTTLLK